VKADCQLHPTRRVRFRNGGNDTGEQLTWAAGLPGLQSKAVIRLRIAIATLEARILENFQASTAPGRAGKGARDSPEARQDVVT
jgi:hypothetical protein